jgi:protein SDA1
MRGVDGIELLEEAEGKPVDRILTDEDFKKIKMLKLKKALKGVVKDKDEEKKESDDEEGESEIDESGEEGEDEWEDDEEGEQEDDSEEVSD